MAILSRERNWVLEDGDGEHAVRALIANRGVAVHLEITVDGEPRTSEKSGDVADLHKDYAFAIGECDVTVRAMKKGFLGVATDFELLLGDRALPEGRHALPRPADTTPEEAPPAGAPGVVRSVPVLPQRCPGCAAQVRAEEAKWTGPLAAECAYCGGALDATWRRVE